MDNKNKTSNAIDIDINKVKGKLGLNYDEFNMIKTKIELLETISLGIAAKTGEPNVVLKLSTSELNGSDIRGSELISLFKNKETGEWNYSENPNSKAMQIMKFFKVENLGDLKDKECTSLVRMNKDGIQRIGIYTG